MNRTRAQAMLVVIRSWRRGGKMTKVRGNRFQVEGSVKFVHIQAETGKADTLGRMWQ